MHKGVEGGMTDKDVEKVIWEYTVLHLQKGDILTSNKGILLQSPLTDEFYIAKKVRFEGKNLLVVEGSKERTEVKEVKP